LFPVVLVIFAGKFHFDKRGELEEVRKKRWRMIGKRSNGDVTIYRNVPKDNTIVYDSNLHLGLVDFENLYAKKNNLTPLESVEVFLLEQQCLRTEKQNLIRRRRANLPAEKTLETFDFGFQRGVSKEQMLRLSDMTWVEQAFNICFLGTLVLGIMHLALSLAVQALNLGYAVALDRLIHHCKILNMTGNSCRLQHRKTITQ
jgi:DNA replication protein DnaC